MSMLIRNLSLAFDCVLGAALGSRSTGSEKSILGCSGRRERAGSGLGGSRRVVFAIGMGFGFIGGEIGCNSGFFQAANGSLVLLCVLLRERFACNAFQGSFESDMVKPRKTA
jgi:hypothetical protein